MFTIGREKNDAKHLNKICQKACSSYHKTVIRLLCNIPFDDMIRYKQTLRLFLYSNQNSHNLLRVSKNVFCSRFVLIYLMSTQIKIVRFFQVFEKKDLI